MKRSLGKEKWKEVKLEDARKYQQKSWEENIQEREEKNKKKGCHVCSKKRRADEVKETGKNGERQRIDWW